MEIKVRNPWVVIDDVPKFVEQLFKSPKLFKKIYDKSVQWQPAWKWVASMAFGGVVVMAIFIFILALRL
tara:strand:- start:2412 stop:2618 length:207 start_codon:yes stop_codon:yes gene_type:complete